MHRLFTFSLMLITGMVLCSCATSVKQKKLQTIAIPDNWQSKSRSHFTDKDSHDIIDLTDSVWFDYFENNTQLQSLIKQGILSNKDLVIASSRVDRAMAELRAIQPNRLPSVDINAQGKRQKINEASQTFLSSDGPSNCLLYTSPSPRD